MSAKDTTPNRGSTDSMTWTLSSAFSSICFGISLAYLGERILLVYRHDWLAMILAAVGFIKLVDSWWWYFYVLEQTKPADQLLYWYWDFVFCLFLFLLMGLADDPAAWFCAFAVCNFIGCWRIDCATRAQTRQLVRECRAGQLMWTFGPWAATFAAIASTLASLLLHAKPWERTLQLDAAAFAFIVGTSHLMVTRRAWRTVRGSKVTTP
jgi:hypothetical protein